MLEELTVLQRYLAVRRVDIDLFGRHVVSFDVPRLLGAAELDIVQHGHGAATATSERGARHA